MVAPLLAAALPALIGGVASAAGTMMANEQADRASQRQMDFQKETLRNQYQWGMQDMKAAGLNPILAYKQGGAGSAGGSSYTPQNVGSAAVSGASTAVSSALQARAQETQLENLAADTSLKHAQDKTQAALQVQALAQAGQASANSALAVAQTHKTRAEIGIMGAEASRAAADEQLLKENPWLRQAGTAMRELGLSPRNVGGR